MQKCRKGEGGQNGVIGPVHATNGVGGQASTYWLGQNSVWTTVSVRPPCVSGPPPPNVPAAWGAAPTAPGLLCVSVYIPWPPCWLVWATIFESRFTHKTTAPSGSEVCGTGCS